MIKFYEGSVFDSKCDLLILPCNDGGGQTRFVRNGIIEHDLPRLDSNVEWGNVKFILNTGAMPSYTMVGYASSVHYGSSNETILRSILIKIKERCREEGFQNVNIPLLGTGAGKMEPERVYEIMTSEFKAEADILLCVYILSLQSYDRIFKAQKNDNVKQVKNPRVFISYTGTDEDNKKWVKDLATRLRSSGVNARLDVFHLKHGSDLPQWMTNELLMADKVLLICDKYYTEKADSRNGGVGWETMVIQGDMLSCQANSKYIAIIREANAERTLPIYMRSKYAFDWSDDKKVDSEFEKLLLEIFDCDEEPPIGEIPGFIQAKMKK